MVMSNPDSCVRSLMQTVIIPLVDTRPHKYTVPDLIPKVQSPLCRIVSLWLVTRELSMSEYQADIELFVAGVLFFWSGLLCLLE